MRLYPHFPSLPRYPGPYHVGTTELEVQLPQHLHKAFGDQVVKTLLVRLFYPTAATSGSKPRWTGQGNYTIQGYSKFLGVNETLLRIVSFFGLKWTRIPALSNSQLQARPPGITDSSGARWPCCVFSHGLGGTRNAYSQISGSIAAGGVVVMSLEHRDNSAAISVQRWGNEPEEIIDYVPIKETNARTVQKRRHQMAQRAYEVRLGIELFRALEASVPASTATFAADSIADARKRLSSFAGKLDVEAGRLIMAGHSMGAATTVHVCKDSTTVLPSDPQKYSLRAEFRAAILLDPWMEVLVDSSSRPMQVPTIAIASQAFHDWSGNWREVVRLLKGQHKLNRLCWLKRSAHLSQSDFQLLFPTATKLAFKAEIEPARAMGLNVRLVRSFLRDTVGLEVPKGEKGIGEENKDVWIEDDVVEAEL